MVGQLSYPILEAKTIFLKHKTPNIWVEEKSTSVYIGELLKCMLSWAYFADEH